MNLGPCVGRRLQLLRENSGGGLRFWLSGDKCRASIDCMRIIADLCTPSEPHSVAMLLVHCGLRGISETTSRPSTRRCGRNRAVRNGSRQAGGAHQRLVDLDTDVTQPSGASMQSPIFTRNLQAWKWSPAPTSTSRLCDNVLQHLQAVSEQDWSMLNSGEDPALCRYKGATLSTPRMYLVRALMSLRRLSIL